MPVNVPAGDLAQLRTLLNDFLDLSPDNAVIRFKSPLSWTANGTAGVSLTNLAPSGVGTATINKWLTLEDNAGVVMYIPAFT